VDAHGHPLRAKFAQLPGFTRKAIALWTSEALCPGTTTVSDGLACFAGVTEAGCLHEPVIVGGRKPKEVPVLHWVNTVLGNVKSGLSGAYHAFDFDKYAERYLVLLCWTEPLRGEEPRRQIKRTFRTPAAICEPFLITRRTRQRAE
jgi:hypothetical protein